jgi:hypothetical protein
MSSPEKFRPADAGTPVEVRAKFNQEWVRGFEVAEPVEEPTPGYRIVRRSDRSVLPVVFPAQDVRVDDTCSSR